jgi:segregation and condensation protein B
MNDDVIEQEVTEEITQQSAGVMSEEDLFQHLRALEALLFTSQDLMTEKELSQFFPAGTDVELLLEHMQQQYENRGVNVVKRGNGWGLRTSPDLSEKLEVRKVETRPLSRAAIETLAIIAYHQPVTRAEIEQIRGVSISKSTFELLVAETLIKPGKRRDVVGRPLTWITTQNFLDSFGLENIKQLPNLQELKEAGLLSVMPPQLGDGIEQPSLPMMNDEQLEVEEPTEEYSDDEFAEQTEIETVETEEENNA